MITQVCEPPADTATALPPTATVEGLFEETVDPTPSCPFDFEPQHFNAQVLVIAQV